MLSFGKNFVAPTKKETFVWDGKLTLTREDTDPHIRSIRIPAWGGGPILTGKIVVFTKDALLTSEDLAVLRKHLDAGSVVYVDCMQFTDSKYHFIVDGTRLFDRLIAEATDEEVRAEIEAMTAVVAEALA